MRTKWNVPPFNVYVNTSLQIRHFYKSAVFSTLLSSNPDCSSLGAWGESFKENADGARGIFGTARRVWATALRLDPPKKWPCATLVRLVGRITNTSSNPVLAEVYSVTSDNFFMTFVEFEGFYEGQALRARLCRRKISDSIFWLYYFTPRWLAGAMPCPKKVQKKYTKGKDKNR